MGRKVKRGRQPYLAPVTTADLRRDRLWTEDQLDEFLAKVDIQLAPWQRDALLRFGNRRTVGVHNGEQNLHHTGRSAGKNTVHRLTKELALALGHEVKPTVNGFEVSMAFRDEVRL
ncbi:hypothetical protein [Rhodococcus phage REQ1]|uniref:hypothetical protein n=1 Tax=Rhodococcus phage REQ1 TaxID=1109712 RepID=UPI00023EEC5C|nr:hypothetical protein RoPhREQ1_gp58 [Rhodococcus phage REQ1]AEV52054.1 hypothetical protein [Rhodococcus phage REQ1]